MNSPTRQRPTPQASSRSHSSASISAAVAAERAPLASQATTVLVSQLVIDRVAKSAAVSGGARRSMPHAAAGTEL
jgi:hypothetical protein